MVLFLHDKTAILCLSPVRACSVPVLLPGASYGSSSRPMVASLPAPSRVISVSYSPARENVQWLSVTRRSWPIRCICLFELTRPEIHNVTHLLALATIYGKRVASGIAACAKSQTWGSGSMPESAGSGDRDGIADGLGWLVHMEVHGFSRKVGGLHGWTRVLVEDLTLFRPAESTQLRIDSMIAFFYHLALVVE